MADRRKPIVTELALADALDQLVKLIDELRADADLRVEIATDETELVKLIFSGTAGESVTTKALRRNHTLVGHVHGASNLPGSVIKPTRVPVLPNDGAQVTPVSLTGR